LNVIEKDQLERAQKENIGTSEDVGPNLFDITLLIVEGHDKIN
jgi:hypothetical protein